MRATIIINPASGHRDTRDGPAEARAELARRIVGGIGPEIDPADVTVVLTERRGHAAELVRSALAREADVVVAWGGDGTVNEIAGGLIGTRTPLGIVPSGSGDGLARSLELPRAPAAALRLALVGPAGAIDTGIAGDRHFLNIAGVGFDAAVAAAFDRSPSRGVWSYVRCALGEVWSYEPGDYRVETDGAEALAGRFLLLAVANGREYGNRLQLEAAADPRDGWLNLVAVEAGPAWRQLWRSRRLAFRPSKPAQGVARRPVRSLMIRASRLQCHVDGEPFEAAGRLEVAIRPRSLFVKGLAP